MRCRGPFSAFNPRMSLALSKLLEAKGADLAWRRPSIGFGAVYNYDSNELNNYSTYYNNFTPNNVSFGLQVSLPFFDFAVRAKAKVSSAEALRSKVEAEQAQEQNDTQISQLTASLRELDAQAEVASLKQQIAEERLKSVAAQLEAGNGAIGTSRRAAAAIADCRATGAYRRAPKVCRRTRLRVRSEQGAAGPAASTWPYAGLA